MIEYRPGTTFSDTVPPELRGVSSTVLADEFITALAELHTIDLDHHPELGELGRPKGFIERQIVGWSRRAVNAYDGSPPSTVDRIIGWLQDSQPDPDAKPSVLHCDYKFDNVIFDESGAATAVIDWDMSTLGDPLFDLGITLSYWAQSDDHAVLRDLRMAPSLQPGFPDRCAVAQRYFEAAERAPAPLGFYLALGRFRTAIAWQQMYVLHQRGALVGPRYASFDQVAAAILATTADSLSTEDI